MDDYAAYLAEEAKSDIAALHQFRILYEPAQESYHFFFEGEEDSLFFMPEARRHILNNVAYIYDCGGKRNVIQVRDDIKANGYNVDTCLFFVDRDYDDFLGTQVTLDENTYITDQYSVENDISTIVAARILMADVLRISQADPDFAKIEATFTDAYRAFHLEVRALIGWILAAKEEKCSPNLRNTTGLKNIVTLVGVKPELTKNGFIEFKRKVVVNGKLPSIPAILRWTRRLDLGTAGLWIRGKYDIWFFHSIILAALEEVNLRRKAAGGRAISIPASLREGRFFEVLGARVPVPTSLQAFYATKFS
ncbi:DUF4435 domain-containing protein [Pseudomonas sp. ICBG1301]|uniref:DUF4435 domain-containing protein n=1 Tax=Pseudomonas sp. ICBG1301 TaxID=2795987 RepID=UPI0019633737|nr:DUF4435 domain-containing protein [Pseudomonas sp. ICBG1301]MBM9488007.1 DUF4435 domain-containing protein [Pseudomonas sp. ICBG1301]